jgi:hypothetical protein
MSFAPGVGPLRPLLAAALLLVGASPRGAAAASFSLQDGMAQMADFRDGTFTMRARPQFDRPDGYLALAFGSDKSATKYYWIVTATTMKLWRLGANGSRRLLDEQRLALSGGREIVVKFAIKDRRYFAEIAGYPPLEADDEESFTGRLVLRVAGVKVDYDDPVLELARR